MISSITGNPASDTPSTANGLSGKSTNGQTPVTLLSAGGQVLKEITLFNTGANPCFISADGGHHWIFLPANDARVIDGTFYGGSDVTAIVPTGWTNATGLYADAE